MIFRRISHRIAWQFTGFVFLLFLFNGVVFFAADIRNASELSDQRLRQTSSFAVRSLSTWPRIRPEQLPPHLRDRVRIVNLQGKELYVGSFFSELPFTDDGERREITVEGDEYGVLTMPLIRRGVGIGFIQVVEPERLPMQEIWRRIFLYLLISVGVSALTYVVGLFFARRSLRPAEETMQRLEQFTQDASHELRTPLAALRSSLDLALKSGKLEQGIRSAKEDVDDITRLVERLLELASLDGLTLEKLTMDASAIVKDAVTKQRPLAEEKKLTLESDVAEPVLLEGDSALFRQVVMNLVANALKFTPEGGTVKVTLTRKQLSVEDTGIGIPKDLQRRVFDRFFQADASRAHGGYGLGLALVKRVVELHGWKVSVGERAGGGAVFTVAFGRHSS